MTRLRTKGSNMTNCNKNKSNTYFQIQYDLLQKRGKGGVIIDYYREGSGLIDYYKDSQGNFLGVIPELEVTNNKNSYPSLNGSAPSIEVTPIPDRDNLWGTGQDKDFSDIFKDNLFPGANGGDNDFMDDIRNVERGKIFANQIASGNVPIVCSNEMQMALNAMDGVSKAETVMSLVPNVAEIFKQDIGLLKTVGKVTGALNFAYGVYQIFVDYEDGEFSPKDQANAASVICSGISIVVPAFGVLSVALLLVAAALPGDKGSGQSSSVSGGY